MRGAVSTKTQRGRMPVEARMPPQRTLGQFLKLGDGFDAREAGAGEDEGEAALRAARVGVGELDLAQHVVAQADRVADVLERERVLGRAGDAAERDHEPLVGDGERAGLAGDVSELARRCRAR